ncbi:hypothetical protein GH714_029820 [Hevea brasiliensis]|uniref:Uncharacterized protein n=1 Tax=Hevea brasiliensis TaxID=3981 RepID=A0A6A6K8N7_HEVBR|nr:hypothetical protein GH714_029820 [Hevea brasiliensis]
MELCVLSALLLLAPRSGLVKASIICPLVVGIIVIGNSAVIIGLWIAHFIWTFYCVARTKRLGLVLKFVVLLLLPLPLVLWPVVGIAASFLGGIGYGFFAPLLATFEAVGENVRDKFYHCFVVIKIAKLFVGDPNCCACRCASDNHCCTLEKPIHAVPRMEKAIEDLIGREGPFLETVCVPFAGLAIILWPLAVVGSVIGAIISSLFLGLYSAVIVHQEDSLLMGLAYVVAVVSLFDEYVNDLLYLSEGSCLPRFSGSPEPCSDYYVALVSDGEVVLLLGDYKNKAYKRTKARPALVDPTLFYKKENVFAKKSFSTRAKFDERKQEHDIVVESSTSGPKEPEMWISIDGIVVIHVKNLQWKFRGNQTVILNKQQVQVLWDVHDWLFNSPGAGHGVFVFKPWAPETDDDKDGNSDTSDGSKYFSTTSNTSTPEFCLLLYAWKMD